MEIIEKGSLAAIAIIIGHIHNINNRFPMIIFQN